MQINDVTVEQEESVACDVERILKAKFVNPAADTSNEETGIHRLVYALYSLTDDETAAVESRYANTMTFPDQSHINRVRDALWQRYSNGASVMVGSGFSRNSVPSVPQAITLPTWEEVTSRLHSELYPQESDTRYFNQLRTAQEYEAAFGRGALHDALRRLVRHEEHHPGSTHQRLLQLPWQDIYTTNWDTLLERAQGQVTEQHYSTVTNVDEIPMAGRPRIVKLHGSLPAQFPLIVTEEDYRTYPAKFAPFVNTVQQSMMETVFLLIGFSGDDPNFLNWSGWVRDNLGPSALKIYLAGWLGLSPHRRRMLESHSVIPIDLAQHPRAGEWPDNLRHEYATEWLLHTLELGRPYDITSWPTAPNRQSDDIPSVLQPIETATTDEPRPEPTTRGIEPVSSPEEVRKITAIWRHNRLIYPGWLTMPPFNQRRMELDTDTWGRTVLASLSAMKSVERLRSLRELVWRGEILLIPMHPDLQIAIQETLGSIDCQIREIDGAAAPTEDWTAIREDWRNAAVALVTAARFQFDREAFKQAVKALEPFQDEDPDLRHRILHEKCLLAIYYSDFNWLGDLLAGWKPENCDPIWTMRKAALLWEAGRNSEARELLNFSLAAIKAMPPDEHGIASLSRESWETFVALDFDNRFTLLDRLRELAPMRCDPFQERQNVTDGMGKDQAEEDPPPFDINRRRGTSERWVNYDPIAAAYRAVRLAEMAGLPPRTDHSSVWTEVLKKAAEEVADDDLEFAVRLVLRACNGDNDKTLGRVLTRTRVATLPTGLAEALTECCLNSLEKAMRDKVERASATQQQFNAAAEVLSRLVIRLEPDQVETILNKAVGYCQSAELAKSLFDSTVRNLLLRSWEALPSEHRRRRAVDLLGAEIVGLNNIEPAVEYSWPDPGEVVGQTELLRTPENESQWQATINLIVRGLTGNQTARRRAASRMIPLAHSDQLTEDESLRIATALWSEQHTAPDGLPRNTALFDWSFLTFPEPTLGLAEQRFRTKWLSHDANETYDIQRKNRGFQMYGNSPNGLNHDHQDVESRLWQAGTAMWSLQEIGQNLALSQADSDHLTKLLESWADDPVPKQNAFTRDRMLKSLTQQLTLDMANALPPLISEITVSQPLADKIHTKMQELTANHLPAFALAIALVKINPERVAEIATTLRIGVTSDDSQLATNAFLAMHRWLETASEPESQVPQPPDDLVREIGIAIASLRNTAVTAALQVAAWIFENGQDSHKEAIQNLAEGGLRYLAEELQYDRRHEDPDEIPRKRLYCAALAAAMAKSGLEESPAVATWLEVARDDPLPEVRHAVEKPVTE